MVQLAALGAALCAGLVSAGAYPPDVVDELAESSMPKLKDWLAKNPQPGCTYETAAKRTEWSDLSLDERKQYTNAVLCLQSKPALMSSQAPGAKSRFDDYVVVHIQQTPRNHGSYWNWDRYAKDPASSPLFDGSEGSMGGNGAKVAHQGIPIPGAPRPYDMIPPGDGGGCVTTGPFKNMTVNLGPIAPTLQQIPRNPRVDGLGSNPRCLRRDINKHAAAVTMANYTHSLIRSNSDVYWFQTVMEGQFPQGKWGVHAGGHYTVSGDPAGDFYVSPGDPVFWLHHAMIDRVWWIWQLQDLERRLAQVSMTRTMNNFPPSANGTLDDLSGLGVLAPDVKVRELMNTMGGLEGKFCYVYE
ncbi:Di-copper centre-containing protein [Parathielavia appendiculata]|uniref:Di-copper centre-containing protein n=1 Tax=Parathielavia appendiculata TaxID=2587402 RepID=A0AAN6TQA1_9PEZI|nr:Di-copper centre-containing protein [Parathielavia appendiculata]